MTTTTTTRCAGVLACLDGYMNIAMEQTEVRREKREAAARAWNRGEISKVANA